jgi:hypothetical protein
VSRSNENPQTRERAFGYPEALAEVIADLTASEARRLEAERAARRTRWPCRSVLLDERGVACVA